MCIASPDYRIQRTVERHRVRAASALFRCAPAARYTRQYAAAVCAERCRSFEFDLAMQRPRPCEKDRHFDP